MKSHLQTLIGLTVLAIVSPQLRSQSVAPATLPPCLIQFENYLLGNTTTRLTRFDSDRTYHQINYVSLTNLTGTVATHNGTYSYTVDPSNDAHATIVYDGGMGASPPDQLYFTTGATGMQSPPNQIQATGISSSFVLSPKQIGNDGSNFSNQSQLAAGGSSISGFIVQSSGPRWVLIRAIGSTLEDFGVSSAVSKPSFTLYSSNGTVAGSSSVWDADPNLVAGYTDIFAQVGAFALNASSDDSVLLISLPPGAYTAVFKAATAGDLLSEVYFLPY